MNASSRAWLQQFAASVFAAGKLYPTAATDPAALRALVKSLAPLNASKDLIRLGPDGDGGYLVPDDLSGIEACFSPGVSSVSGFEKACAERGMKIFLADKSVDAPAESHPLFSFTRKHVGATTSDDVMTMDNWVRESLPDERSELLLQMDIEGAEYETLLATSDALLRRFRIAVMEFHWLDHLWSKPFFRVASSAFRKLLQSHACVHIHPNNCCGSLKLKGLEMPRVCEFTFLRRDRLTGRSYATQFPHPLDRDNENKAPLPLPASWIGGDSSAR
jgi:hypothetical protein